MRRLLAAAVLAATLPAAHAQDKGKTDFSVNGEFRLRHFITENIFGNSEVHQLYGRNTNISFTEQRFKLGLNFKVNEKVSFRSTLIQAGTFGGASTETIGNHATVASNTIYSPQSGETSNFMSVNEAFASVLLADNLTTRIGRMNYSFGDGTVMSVNDGSIQPNSFDGVNAVYNLEFGKFDFFAFRYRDLANKSTTMTSSHGGHEAYGLVFDLKTVPEMVKMAQLHVIQDVADGVWGTTSTAATDNVQGLQNQNTLRWGLLAKVAMFGFDLKGNYEMVGGKYSDPSGTGAVAKERTVKMSMYQAELGYSMPDFVKSRFWVRYHVDSGTSKDDRTAGETESTYDGYFYDRGMYEGGNMVVGWGNLTMTQIGWSLEPTDKMKVNLIYAMMQKTDGGDITKGGYYGGPMFANPATLAPLAATADEKKDIGSSIVASSTYAFENGVSAFAAISYFAPGSYMKDDTIKKGDARTGYAVAAKMTF